MAEKNLGKRLFALLAEQLDVQKLIVRRGSLIDATLIKAQLRPPQRGQPSRDSEAEWTNRGKDGHFGYKIHLSVDYGSGLIRNLTLTGTNVAESYLFEELIMGKRCVTSYRILRATESRFLGEDRIGQQH